MPVELEEFDRLSEALEQHVEVYLRDRIYLHVDDPQIIEDELVRMIGAMKRHLDRINDRLKVNFAELERTGTLRSYSLRSGQLRCFRSAMSELRDKVRQGTDPFLTADDSLLLATEKDLLEFDLAKLKTTKMVVLLAKVIAATSNRTQPA